MTSKGTVKTPCKMAFTVKVRVKDTFFNIFMAKAYKGSFIHHWNNSRAF